jgi:hypothetical protein
VGSPIRPTKNALAGILSAGKGNLVSDLSCKRHAHDNAGQSVFRNLHFLSLSAVWPVTVFTGRN